MKNLLLSSCIALLITSCTIGHYNRLKKITGNTSTYPKSIFGENFNSFLFKTNITVYGKNFSGLLITKQLLPQDYRVIFTTELGMKLFDFEFKDTIFALHYCVPQFNNPKLLKTIRKDIELLLMNDLKNKIVDSYNDPKELYTIYKIKNENRYNYYFIEKGSQHLVKIEHSKKNKKDYFYS